MPYIYILKSIKNNRYYIGSTNDIERRIKEHNDGKSNYTKLTKPFELVLKQEFETLNEARMMELHLKKLKSRIIIEKIILDQIIKTKVRAVR
jgi:putative endonuclease